METARAIGSAVPRPRKVLTRSAYAMSMGTSAAMIRRLRSRRGRVVMCSARTR